MPDSNQFALTALMILGTACQSTGPSGLSTQDEATFRTVAKEWTRAATAGDGNAIVALYAREVTLIPFNAPGVTGEAAKQYWVDFTNDYSGGIELKTSKVRGHGDMAYATGTYRLALKPKKIGVKPLPVNQGKWVNVYKKQADGSWKILFDFWNPQTSVTVKAKS